MQINLTKAQHKKLSQGKGVQISNHQLVNKHGEIPHEFNFDQKKMNRIHRNVVAGKGVRISGGDFLGTLRNIGSRIASVAKPVLQVATPLLAKAAGNYLGGPLGGEVAGAVATEAVKGMGVGKFKKGSVEAREHMARIRGMRKTKGKGIFDTVKKAGMSAARAAAPVLIRTGSKMATDALVNHVTGDGLYRKVRQTRISQPSGVRRPSKRIVNPRIKPQGRIIINGIDQVEGGVDGVQGGSYASWGYA